MREGRRLEIAFLLAVLGAFFLPQLAGRRVLLAHDNALEVGVAPSEGFVSNRRFADQGLVFLPEVHHHLHGDHEGWISTWNPCTELGRRTYHVSGFSKAWVLFHVLSWGIDDAPWMITALATAAALGIALFGWLFLCALGLHPAARLAGAIGLACGVFVAYWLCFPMFLWGICWTLALLWGTTRFLERPGIGWGLAIAFFVHALLLTGYLQQTVYAAYLVAGHALWRALRSPLAARARAARLAGLAAAAAVGAASVAPVYIDLLETVRRSWRSEADAEFFVGRLPALEGWRAWAAFVQQRFDPLWTGNPAHAEGERVFNGFALTPLFFALFFVALAPGLRRRLWPALAWVGACLLLTVWPAAYRLAVEHAGLGVSRGQPLVKALVPSMVVAAVAADALLRGAVRRGPARALAVLAVLAGAGLGLASERELEPGLVAAGLVLGAGALAFVWFPRPWLLVLLATAGAFHYGRRLVLERPRADVHLRSGLVDLLREATADGSRFAWVDKTVPALPSNQEMLHGLRSVHTTNSLASLAYLRWSFAQSGDGAETHGRRCLTLDSASGLDPARLRAAGVRVLLSSTPLPSSLARLAVPRAGPFGVYELRGAPVLESVVERFRREGERAWTEGALRPGAGVRRTLDQDDHLAFALAPAPRPTLLFVSQQHHRDWRASADGRALETVLVDDLYLGVVVPPGTRAVDLRFLPAVRWAWLPQVGFAAAAAALCLRALLARRRRRAPALE